MSAGRACAAAGTAGRSHQPVAMTTLAASQAARPVATSNWWSRLRSRYTPECSSTGALNDPAYRVRWLVNAAADENPWGSGPW
jgi:hypothetical protein